MKNSSSLKTLARTKLTGNYGTSVSLTLLTGMIILLINYLEGLFSRSYENIIVAYLFSFVISALFGAFSYLITSGYSFFFLNLSRDREISTSNLFYPFRKHPDTFILTYLITFAFSWIITLPIDIFRIYYNSNSDSLLSIIVGFVCQLVAYLVTMPVTLGFSLGIPIIFDNPSISPVVALKESWQLMKGKKLKVFYIYMSFLGWTILSIMTLGIGLLWVTPYINTTRAFIYLDIIGELEQPKPLHSTVETQEVNSGFYY